MINNALKIENYNK